MQFPQGCDLGMKTLVTIPYIIEEEIVPDLPPIPQQI
jgi:hypothetical protein